MLFQTSVQFTNLLQEAQVDELLTYFKVNQIKIPVCLADLNSDLDLNFQATCRQAGLPGTLGSVYSLAWTQACFQKLQSDCLILEQTLEVAFCTYLQKKDKTLTIPHLVLIGDTPTEPANLTSATIIHSHFQSIVLPR